MSSFQRGCLIKVEDFSSNLVRNHSASRPIESTPIPLASRLLLLLLLREEEEERRKARKEASDDNYTNRLSP